LLVVVVVALAKVLGRVAVVAQVVFLLPLHLQLLAGLALL
jgi:hypothetical protein